MTSLMFIQVMSYVSTSLFFMAEYCSTARTSHVLWIEDQALELPWRHLVACVTRGLARSSSQGLVGPWDPAFGSAMLVRTAMFIERLLCARH